MQIALTLRAALTVVAAAAAVTSGCARGHAGGEVAGAPGGPYVGQTRPGPEPLLFAPGFVSTGLNERDVAITPDGTELYFSVFLRAQGSFSFTIMVTEEVDGEWTPPRTAPFSGLFSDVEPCISADGRRLIFVSNRPLEPGGAPLGHDVNLWAVERTTQGWSEPLPLGPTINTGAMEAFPSLTIDGTLYFTRNDEAFTRSDIYRARLKDGRYDAPEKLPEVINAVENPFNAFIAPDESYLIFSAYGTDGSFGASDYLISFRGTDDGWSEPRNLGAKINSAGKETSTWVSWDGRYLFFASDRCAFVGEGYFTRPDGFVDRSLTYEDLAALAASPGNCNQDIYWVDTSIIDELRSAATSTAETG